jgi:haloacetate dehalogenase
VFDSFRLDFIDLPEVRIRVRWGGCGPPLLLLHGHPRTHTTWYMVAPLLAQKFTVFCPDLRGFGQSSAPNDGGDLEWSSKRSKALDCINLMGSFGYQRFLLAGHDRGSYTAFRCAMDHPHAVERLALLDCVPILEALERTNAKFARLWWHWFFFAQPEKPEQAILANPLKWYGGSAKHMGQANFDDFAAAVQNPAIVRGMIDDYRAGIFIDHIHDAEDREAQRLLEMPLLVLWSKNDDLEEIYGDPLVIWKAWATQLMGRAIDSSHHMAETSPGDLARELEKFFLGD